MASGSPARAGSSAGSSDWTVQAADTIEKVVVTIRDKTTVPLQTVARALVYGLVAAVMGTAALVLVLAGLMHLLDYALPFGVWLPDAILGTLFAALGLLLWGKRSPKGGA